MAYKTFSKEDIKAKGYDLMCQTLDTSYPANIKVAVCCGIGKAIDNILKDFEEKEDV